MTNKMSTFKATLDLNQGAIVQMLKQSFHTGIISWIS